MMKTLAAFLAERGDEIVAAADASMARAHLPHYEQAGAAQAKERLQALFTLVVRCARERHLAPMVDHAARIAADRHGAGFDLGEVQTAMNVLEEAIWRAVLADLPAAEQGEALGLVATILGAAKDKLACAYVSLATTSPTRSLDLARLFEGPIEGEPAQA